MLELLQEAVLLQLPGPALLGEGHGDVHAVPLVAQVAQLLARVLVAAPGGGRLGGQTLGRRGRGLVDAVRPAEGQPVSTRLEHGGWGASTNTPIGTVPIGTEKG